MVLAYILMGVVTGLYVAALCGEESDVGLPNALLISFLLGAVWPLFLVSRCVFGFVKWMSVRAPE